MAYQLTKHSFDSAIYQGTTRDYWLYIPEQLVKDTPANLMVFQDGYYYIDEAKPMKAHLLIDSLIAANKIPATVCVFINPGIVKKPTKPEHHPDGQRSFEYDTISDQYGRFLINELLPEALAGLNISQDPKSRAMVGFSSGGICAWTVAWNRSDLFGNVISHCGSFVDIRGGGQYPSLIRTEDPKAIRIFLQSGENDLDTKYGSWPLGNKLMAAALKFTNYDYQFEFGSEGHNLIHGGQLLESSLLWLFGHKNK
ncbi:MAG: alpha/beta hydrolase-fold protein [Colwellia sp.]|nr:alpha/beta hydrolase-fold protein [Colwellia sp.]